MPRTARTQQQPQFDTDQVLRLDNQLCFALYASSLAMTKAYKPLLEPLGLTYPQYLVMLVLWETDGLNVASLGQRLSLNSGTLTPLLKRLESTGLIRRQRAQDDERRVDIFLTAEGQALKRSARAIPTRLACASACSFEELAELTSRLQRLRRELDSQNEHKPS
ncbi:MarR family transcriptional regulator [Paucibacter sp. AS339]|uniref:MarR family winged helix-turn-helix transcriptional regulator n=1 Tax=Paucibacter hankyongi TaxID=3133434 RepID=UPI0030A1393E